MKQNVLKIIALLLFPVVTIAQTLSTELVLFVKIINALMPFTVGLAVLFFMFGVFQFIRASGNEDEITEGRNRMIYGIIGIFVMVSVWGLVNLLDNTFGLTSDIIPCLPTFPPSC
ncbi:MAG: hypothetical protein HZB09_00310 [Candidatus Yonathbacteria bacterium]|nr:hypothetical protein [Candidatus Yonathbacteria bacterium]